MRELTAFVEGKREASDQLTLPFELRQRSRLRARLDGGDEVALLLPRGRVLRDGDLVTASDGFVVRVRAAKEQVSTVTGADAVALTRGAYHLGNRHVPMQVGAGFLRYQRDHVLDEMVRGLGLVVLAEDAPFEPEAGAYGDHEYAHGGRAGHGHGHGHSHGPSDRPAHSHASTPPRAPGWVLRNGVMQKRARGGYDHGDGDES